MAIYLLCFFISAFLFACSERTDKGIYKNALVFLAILIPTVLAGCRDSSVGSDVAGYGMRNYTMAYRSDSFSEYFNAFVTSALSDPLYHFIVYILSRFSENYHLGLFVYNLIFLLFAYAGMRRYNKIFNTPIWIGMLLYYLALYNISLNIMRQSIAVSIVFFASSYLFENKYIKFMLFVLIAMGFHSSGLVGFLFLPMYLIMNQNRGIKEVKQIVQGTIFIIIVCIVLAVGSKLTEWLVASGIIRVNYLNYLSSGAYASHRISAVSVLLYLLYVFIYLIHYRRINRKKQYSLFFFMFSCLMLISMFGSLVSTYISRVSYYFMPLQMLSFANITNCYSIKSKKVWVIAIVLYSFIVWLVIFVYRGNHETVPYIFNPGMY